MLAPEWTWWDMAPVILVAVALLWIPGLGLAAGLGAGWWPSVAVAPVLTGSLVAVVGILFGGAGIAWRPLAFVPWLIGIPVVGWGVRLLVDRSRRRAGHAGFRLRVAEPPVTAVVAGLATAAIIGVTVIVLASGAPGNIPQGNDTIYHLGLIRAFVDSGNISALTADGFNHPDAPGFYPALLHGLAATVAMLTAAPGPIAMQAVLVAVTAFAWPLGLIFLVHTLLGANRGLVYLTGALAWVFPSFPAGLLGYGPVWPTVLGNAYVPVVLAVFGVGVRQLLARSNAVPALLLVVLMLPGLAVAHVSAVFLLAVGGLLSALAQTWRQARADAVVSRPGGTSLGLTRRWRPVAAVLGCGVFVFLVSTVIAPAGMVETGYGRTTLPQGVVAALALWSPPHSRLSVAGAGLLMVTLLGAATMLRREAGGWLAVSWAGMAVLGFLTHVLPAADLWPLSWPWYNLPVRIQGAAAVFGVPVAAYGVWAVLSRVRVARPDWLRRAGAAAVEVVLALLIAILTVNGVRTLGPYYTPRSDNVWITADEADALRRISAEMPDNAVVAADPFTGAAFLSIVGPQRMVIPTEKSSSQDITLIADGLTWVQGDRLVCAAVQRQQVTYAITGGRRTLERFKGVHLVGTWPFFVKVAQEGPYTLWKVPPCEV